MMQKMLTIDRIKLKISRAMNLQHFEIGFGIFLKIENGINGLVSTLQALDGTFEKREHKDF